MAPHHLSSARLRFLLNETELEIAPGETPSGLTVLDFIRQHRRLTGTKEGCKEGDCGACVVLVGRLDGAAVRYAPMTSCMMPLAEAAGKHLVTIEGLEVALGSAQPVDVASPNTVQREIVSAGASQCGFCTPGIVVSLVGRMMAGEAPAAADDELPYEVDRALSGHLCRCTGYRSLRDAASSAFSQLKDAQGVSALVAAGELPSYFLAIPERLRGLLDSLEEPAASGDADFVAGGTDLYVQRGEELPTRDVVSLDHWREARPEMGRIAVEHGRMHIGAMVRFEDLAQSSVLRERVPALGDFMDLIASWQIRTRSTVGGNLINASPIGDITVFMLALGAVATFEDRDRPGSGRSLPLEDLYLGYKELDRKPSEVLIEIEIPDLEAGESADFEKVSKRRWLDIATVNTAARIHREGDKILDARLAAGGVAPVPLFLAKTSARLAGRSLDLETLRLTLDSADDEIAPISDVRGSAEYKRLLVRHLLVAHFCTLCPDRFELDGIFGELQSGGLRAS